MVSFKCAIKSDYAIIMVAMYKNSNTLANFKLDQQDSLQSLQPCQYLTWKYFLVEIRAKKKISDFSQKIRFTI